MINLMMLPFPVSETTTDSFYDVLAGVLPLFLILIFILPVYNTTSLIVKEKEQRTKESMRMMGMSDTSYWLSWFVFYSV
jgi:ABC-type Na+ efflux pump permease subunit